MKELNLKPALVSDLVVGVEAIKTACKLRKQGANKIAITTTKTIPVVSFGYWGWTPEWCLKYPGTRDTVRDVFHSFSKEVQHKLTFSPNDGEFVERARLWREALRPALAPKQYSDTIAVRLLPERFDNAEYPLLLLRRQLPAELARKARIGYAQLFGDLPKRDTGCYSSNPNIAILHLHSSLIMLSSS